MSFVLTLVASNDDHPISSSLLSKISGVLGPCNIQQTCQPIWLSKDKAIDIGISGKPDNDIIHALRTMLLPSAIDVFVNSVDGRRKKLLLADMDSTIVEGETLDELATFAGLKDQIAAITAKAMEGEIDFATALNQRVELLEDLPLKALEETLNQTRINPGAESLVRTMRKNGAYCVLVSGGFTFFTEHIAQKIGFHEHHGNYLEIKDDKLTGKVELPILDKHAKVKYLHKYAEHLDIKPGQIMTIGDGANDIPMLQIAGLGVGYKPKDVVAQAVENIIIHGDLATALYVQGYTDQDIEK